MTPCVRSASAASFKRPDFNVFFIFPAASLPHDNPVLEQILLLDLLFHILQLLHIPRSPNDPTTEVVGSGRRQIQACRSGQFS